MEDPNIYDLESRENSRTGICHNYHYADNEPCPDCLSRTVQTCRADEPFVCRTCGRPLMPPAMPSAAAPPPIVEHTHIAHTQPAPETTAPRRPNKLPAILISLGVVALLLIGVTIHFMGRDSSGAAEKQTTETVETKSIEETKADLTYGTWEGRSEMGQPHGQGTLHYSQRRLVSQFDPSATVANPGDYIIGEFDHGQLVTGNLYRTDGTTKYITTQRP